MQLCLVPHSLRGQKAVSQYAEDSFFIAFSHFA
uniref:Uncharacterized protein n=1 Tax=Anguilla anguilla TaxID=7936 RepID=A0A0E9RHS3_ANGAN